MKINPGSIIAGTVALLIDALWHNLFTNPQESSAYFLIKFIIVVFLAELIFRKKDFSEKNILIKTVIFVFIFSVYYRLTEFLFKLPFGYRVPDVIIFGNTYTYETTLPMIILLWSLAHGLAFYLGIKIALKFKIK
ncbi:MAG: hypothetical protein AABY15_04445 [Nanoarchaeota archaeon]